MTLAIVYSRANIGIAAPLVTVEAHLSRGLPRLNIVGLAEATVKESKDRVRSALINSGLEFPRRRMTINLAPADLPKEGGRFDLPIALGILAASHQLPEEALAKYEFIGELALSGELRSVRGVLPAVLAAKQSGRCLIVPASNAEEAALVSDVPVYAATHLLEVCAHLKKEMRLPLCELSLPLPTSSVVADMAEVKGQAFAKRALEIAAAGQHSILFMGPPGTGKTMLASRLPGILPPLREQQALEVAAIASISTMGFDCKNWQTLPFRAPHHTTSSIALVGGGRPPKPGEISLAHHGVLFLDELPEFSRQVIESLREPLESGCITISRVAYQMVFPANFQLIAAMNPCPCGYSGSAKGNCHCTSEQIQRYRAKISGPLLDRVDMQIEVPALPPEVLADTNTPSVETSAMVQARVLVARERQLRRQGKPNALLSVPELEEFCALDQAALQLLSTMMNRYQFSARVYHRLVKLSRTLADLQGETCISSDHLAQALAFRCLDRTKVDL